MTFEVWASAPTRARAALASSRLGRERPDLTFVIAPAASDGIAARDRIKAERKRHPFVIGVWDCKNYERARITGLNA